jgi:hypothetical protein
VAPESSVRKIQSILQIAKLAWASPCSVVGLLFAVVVILLGGRAIRSSTTLEVTFRDSQAPRSRLMRLLPFRAITLGHVIIAITRQELEHLRDHERIHVHQYERWGIFFFVAYVASSGWQLLRGRRAYWDNCFEVEARLLSVPTQQAKYDV